LKKTSVRAARQVEWNASQQWSDQRTNPCNVLTF